MARGLVYYASCLRAVELERQRKEKVLKKLKIMLDKTKVVWYTKKVV